MQRSSSSNNILNKNLSGSFTRDGDDDEDRDDNNRDNDETTDDEMLYHSSTNINITNERLGGVNASGSGGNVIAALPNTNFNNNNNQQTQHSRDDNIV